MQKFATATVVNDLVEAYPGCRLQFVMPKGIYRAEVGQVDFMFDSDDEKFTVVEVSLDLPAQSNVPITLSPAS